MLSSRLSEKSRLRLGIIANEFFDARISRLGGFGMLSKQIVAAAEGSSNPQIDVDLYWGDPPDHIRESNEKLEIYGRPARFPKYKWRREKLSIMAERKVPDLFLTIDYRENYEYYLSMFPRAPMLMWVQDPKTPEDWARIGTTYVPGQEGIEPRGLQYIDCTPLADLVKRRRAAGYKTIFAAPSPFLEAKVESTYGMMPNEVASLCYPMEPAPPGPYVKSEKPTVMFLGRLDPQKRPWMLPEIARRMPDVTFRIFGKSHFSGPGAWEPKDLPSNMEMLGHTEGEEKHRLIASSWLHVNPAIHEGLPIAFVEGLQCEVPIVSNVNPERVPERFGAHVGDPHGPGMDQVEPFVAALRDLIDNDDKRQQLGVEGRIWAEQTHSAENFLRSFERLVAQFDKELVA
ncbi:MAG: glycosyltransferase family 4 protein [Pseudomonadota bacterium]